MVDEAAMLDVVQEKFGEGFQIKEVSADDMVFEQRTILNCFYCGKYGTNWRCPPHLPDLEYASMFKEYDHLAFLWVDMPYGEDDYDEVRSESSTRLHRALLLLEKHLWENDCSTAVSFIGGSCKLCRNGCGKDRCHNPYMSRSPLEATGLNIVKTAQKNGIDIKFPPDGSIMRLGLIAW